MYELYTQDNRRITGPMPIDEAIEKSIELRGQGLKVEVRECVDSLSLDKPEIFDTRTEIFDRVGRVFKVVLNDNQ